MLKTVTLTNFRKVENDTMIFGTGLNVIRGANEASKSTRIEAILYALFGAKVLRDSIDNVVTWGKPANTMSVELTIEFGGELYVFKRSPKGAEVNYSGGIVTGQNEVSNFAGQLLGADANAAAQLMMAGQNQLRGALEQGPKATAQTIESLADFDLFDRLLDAASHKLLTGSTDHFDRKYLEAKEALQAVTVEAPDLSEIDSQIASSEFSIPKLEAEYNTAKSAYEAANLAYSTAEKSKKLAESTQLNLQKAIEQKKVREEQLLRAEAKSREFVDEAEMAELKKYIADASEVEKTEKQYKQFLQVTSNKPAMIWEGSYQSFLDEMQKVAEEQISLQSSIDELYRVVQGARQDVKNMESRVIHSTDCPTCHRPLENHSELLEQNEALKAAIEAKKATIEDDLAELDKLQGKLSIAQATYNQLKGLKVAAAPYEAMKVASTFVEWSDTAYPPTLTWTGPTTFETNTNVLVQRLSVLEDQKTQIMRAQGQVETLRATLQEDAEYIDRLKNQLDELKLDDVEVLREKANALFMAMAEAESKFKSAQEILQTLKQERADQVKFYEDALANRKQLEMRVDMAKSDLDAVVFNNQLLKKIRAARPIIGDKLWSIVLGTVSTMFSQMRGENSLVTKDSDGFAVNGAPITSLSGSTLDLLGLALRVALIRTFMPNSSLLVLDEPGAAMDSDRVTSMLGFLASVGFKQTLLITHEEVSETFADHVITI